MKLSIPFRLIVEIQAYLAYLKSLPIIFVAGCLIANL